MTRVDEWRVAPLVRVETSASLVALTFDDGPDPDATPALLDVLAENGARATFFLHAPNALRYPRLVQRALDEGHEVGLHGWSHCSAHHEPGHGSIRAQRQEMRRPGLSALRGVSLYRPPYGHESVRVRVAALSRGLRLVGWTEAISDWSGADVDTLEARLWAASRPGSIVLLHDGLQTAESSGQFDRGPTVQAVARVLGRFRDEPVGFVTVSELARTGRPVVRRRPAASDPLPSFVDRRAPDAR